MASKRDVIRYLKNKVAKADNELRVEWARADCFERDTKHERVKAYSKAIEKVLKRSKVREKTKGLIEQHGLKPDRYWSVEDHFNVNTYHLVPVITKEQREDAEAKKKAIEAKRRVLSTLVEEAEEELLIRDIRKDEGLHAFLEDFMARITKVTDGSN